MLARTEEAGGGWIAHVMKTIAPASEQVLGVLREEAGRFWLTSVDKKDRREMMVSDTGGAEAGDLVLAEKAGRPPRITARVVERLGDPFAPRSFADRDPQVRNPRPLPARDAGGGRARRAPAAG